MPELPDVEGFRRTFDAHAAGKRVRGVWTDRSELRNANPTRVQRMLAGRVLARAFRHGKFLVCPAEGPALLLHFGMSGALEWQPRRRGHRHDRLILQFADGELHFRDMRKFGGIWLAEDEAEVASMLAPLGPDALRVTPAEFFERFDAHRGGLKALLMDQTFVAGLGNLTVDATLWRARLHPNRPARTLSGAERQRLFREMKRVLALSIPHACVPPRDVLLTTRRAKGARCPRCDAALFRSTVAGRTTWHCPACQPLSASRSAPWADSPAGTSPPLH